MTMTFIQSRLATTSVSSLATYIFNDYDTLCVCNDIQRCIKRLISCVVKEYENTIFEGLNTLPENELGLLILQRAVCTKEAFTFDAENIRNIDFDEDRISIQFIVQYMNDLEGYRIEHKLHCTVSFERTNHTWHCVSVEADLIEA